MKSVFISLLFLILHLGCKVGPRPIDYSLDQCHACKMMIVDNRFGSELVTTKGKVYKYDAIECLVPEVLKNGEQHYKYILITHFNDPGVLKDARASYFLINPERPSPMGKNLSAYAEQNSAQYPSEWITWPELVKHFKR